MIAGIGILNIAATYFYFLIFAQFAFLQLVLSSLGSTAITPVMAVMGVTGLVVSLVVYRLLKQYPVKVVLQAGLFGCALTGVFASYCDQLWSFLTISFLIGGSLGLLTVSLASSLKQYFHKEQIGLCVGFGTGLAYAFSNLPYIFHSSPQEQSLYCSLVCLIAFIVSVFAKQTVKIDAARQSPPHYFSVSAKLYVSFVLAFLALVWFDSAAFYVIQQNSEFKSQTWSSNFSLYLNAVIHLLSAVAAGFFIDKGKISVSIIGAYLLLLIGVACVQGWIFDPSYAAVFYCAGVSLYSTALVVFPSLWRPQGEGRSGIVGDVAFRAACLYAVAGWFGSAMGIGMAQDLNYVPVGFIVISGVVIALHSRYLRIALQSRQNLISILLFGLLFSMAQTADSQEVVNESSESLNTLKGRRVYIEEGCIACHSQYVRQNIVGKPLPKDEEMWGPYVPADEILETKPPLIGNRRIGPDLLNVGIRRSGEWLALHMKFPQLLSPGSVMPSYNHLFEDERGDNLVQYLFSLGRSRLPQRLSYISGWLPKKTASPISKEAAGLLYENNCAQCHGDDGRGDGRVGKLLVIAPRNLSLYSKDIFSSQESRNYLARVVKFGLYGTSMPGHEYFSDDEVLGVVEYIISLEAE